MAYNLKYSYNSELAAYTVTGWENITPNDMVVIPKKYNDGINGEHPVTNIGDSAFYECRSLMSITIPNSVTSIGGSAFNRCENLTSIILPNSINNIGWYLFERCINLTSVTLSDSITRVSGYMFKDCVNLNSIIIPDNITRIEDFAFDNCRSLKIVALLSETPPTLSSTYALPSTITNIYVPQAAQTTYKTNANWATFAGKIKADNLYLSFAKFNNENKKYISRQIQLLKEYIDGRL